MLSVFRQILLACMVFAPFGLIADTEREFIFQAHYKIFSGPLVIGKSTRTLKKIDAINYSFESNSYATGIARILADRQVREYSRLQVVDNRIIPIKYTYQKFEGDLVKKVTSLFDWKTSLVRNSIENLEKNKHSRIELPLADGMLDKLLYQYAIMHDLQNGKFPVEYLIADSRKIKTYSFENAGKEYVNTPNDTIDTVKLLRKNKNDSDDEKVIIWCASVYNFLPVKIETIHEDGSTITAMIHKLVSSNTTTVF